MAGAAEYHQRGVAVYQQQSKSKGTALLDDRAMSTRAVSTAVSKAKTYLAQVLHHQRGTLAAISKVKAYLSCISTAIGNYGESASGRHSRVDQCGISTAISKAKSISGAAVYHQRGIV